jgi:hypothetical protein
MVIYSLKYILLLGDSVNLSYSMCHFGTHIKLITQGMKTWDIEIGWMHLHDIK